MSIIRGSSVCVSVPVTLLPLILIADVTRVGLTSAVYAAKERDGSVQVCVAVETQGVSLTLRFLTISGIAIMSRFVWLCHLERGQQTGGRRGRELES